MSWCPPDAGHVAEHADCPRDAAAGVEHQVLAVVSPQQLHVLGHADGADLQSVMDIIVITVCWLTRSMVKSSTKVEAMDQTVMTTTARHCTPSR